MARLDAFSIFGVEFGQSVIPNYLAISEDSYVTGRLDCPATRFYGRSLQGGQCAVEIRVKWPIVRLVAFLSFSGHSRSPLSISTGLSPELSYKTHLSTKS